MNKKEAQWNTGYLIFAVLALLRDAWNVVVGERHIVGYLKTPTEQGKKVLAANLVEPEQAARLSKYNVPYKGHVA
jgi:hypothetical protein